ncbi:DNA polymerase V [Roseateles asaccharophilus]
MSDDLTSPVPLLAGLGLGIEDVTQFSVQAGFPSPAEDFAGRRIDLTDELVQNASSTFLMRVSGASMREGGIDDGDLIVVDRSLKASHGSVVVGVVDGEFTVKRLWKRGSNVKLQADNPTFPDIVPRDGQTIEIWGVVTSSIRRHYPKRAP